MEEEKKNLSKPPRKKDVVVHHRSKKDVNLKETKLFEKIKTHFTCLFNYKEILEKKLEIGYKLLSSITEEYIQPETTEKDFAIEDLIRSDYERIKQILSSFSLTIMLAFFKENDSIIDDIGTSISDVLEILNKLPDNFISLLQTKYLAPKSSSPSKIDIPLSDSSHPKNIVKIIESLQCCFLYLHKLGKLLEFTINDHCKYEEMTKIFTKHLTFKDILKLLHLHTKLSLFNTELSLTSLQKPSLLPKLLSLYTQHTYVLLVVSHDSFLSQFQAQNGLSLLLSLLTHSLSLSPQIYLYALASLPYILPHTPNHQIPFHTILPTSLIHFHSFSANPQQFYLLLPLSSALRSLFLIAGSAAMDPKSAQMQEFVADMLGVMKRVVVKRRWRSVFYAVSALFFMVQGVMGEMVGKIKEGQIRAWENKPKEIFVFANSAYNEVVSSMTLLKNQHFDDVAVEACLKKLQILFSEVKFDSFWY
jgi:hypothetical protein